MVLLLDPVKAQKSAAQRILEEFLLAAFSLFSFYFILDTAWFALQQTLRDVISFGAYYAFFIIFL
jgi:hypothetical protein